MGLGESWFRMAMVGFAFEDHGGRPSLKGYQMKGKGLRAREIWFVTMRAGKAILPELSRYADIIEGNPQRS